MGIKFDLERLISDGEFVERIKDGIRLAQQGEGLRSDADLVLVAEHEYQDPFKAFWPAVAEMLAKLSLNPPFCRVCRPVSGVV